jgi:cytochrome P450
MSTAATTRSFPPRQPGPAYFDSDQGVWVVTRYADVVDVLRDQNRFSAVNSIGIEPFEAMAPEVREVLATGLPRFPGIIEMDPPDHTIYRRLVNEGFTPRRVAALEPMMREITHGLLDRLPAEGATDFVPAFGDPLPIRVIGELLGVPIEDTDRVQELSDSFRTLEAGTIGRLPPAEQLETAERFVAFQRYVEAMIEARRSRPGEDLATVLTETRLEDGRELTTEELVSTIVHLLFAGQETTTRLIASMLNLLLGERELWERLLVDRELIPTAIEESLRLQPPVAFHLRESKGETEVGDARLGAGDAVALVFAAANRDPEVFDEPDHLDLERENANRHLGLGRGIHFCVGAPIGRLEARVALEILAERMPSLRLGEEGARPESHAMLSGLATLPVEWDRIEPRATT